MHSEWTEKQKLSFSRESMNVSENEGPRTDWNFYNLTFLICFLTDFFNLLIYNLNQFDICVN